MERLFAFPEAMINLQPRQYNPENLKLYMNNVIC